MSMALTSVLLVFNSITVKAVFLLFSFPADDIHVHKYMNTMDSVYFESLSLDYNDIINHIKYGTKGEHICTNIEISFSLFYTYMHECLHTYTVGAITCTLYVMTQFLSYGTMESIMWHTCMCNAIYECTAPQPASYSSMHAHWAHYSYADCSVSEHLSESCSAIDVLAS